MNTVLPIENYFCHRWIKVNASQKYQDVVTNSVESPNVFAVFDDDDAFLDLVEAKHAALFPGRIFSDLLVKRSPAPIVCHTDLDDVVTRLKEQKSEFIAVIDNDKFVGVVSELSLLTALIEQERSMSRERDELIKKIKVELNYRKLATLVFEHTSEGILITDAAARIIHVNHGFTKSTGYQLEEVAGNSLKTLHSDYQNKAPYEVMWKALLETGNWEGEVWNRRKNGDIYPEWLRINAVNDEAGKVTNYVGVFADIGPNKKLQHELQRLAFYDPLTNLPNRRLLLDRLQHAIAASVRNNQYGAILFIDLDNFKTLNDTKGHDIGDLMLIEVARRLQECVRENDTVARLGGDEFVVMLEELSEEPEQAAAQAKMVGEKICDEIGQTYSLQDHEYHSSTSIGISLFRSNEVTIDELLKHADTAMYQSKQSGRNTLRFFDPSMQAVLEARAALEADLRHALSQRQFKLYYQMQVDSRRRIFGAEALLRWEHPARGLVPPAQFIPLAEETGLILPIGHYVLETACAQLKAWEGDVRTRELMLAVNVSARQFRQSDFVEQIRAVLAQTGANPNRLKLEMTESLVLNNVADTIGKMQALKSVGVCFSMDDFGTGYSSLAYLKLLPLDQLKIDQSFVRDIATDPNDAIIVKTIIVMANTLELDVIAEGVETEAQLEILKQYGCPAFQGYLFGKPVPLPKFERLLKQA